MAGRDVFHLEKQLLPLFSYFGRSLYLEDISGRNDVFPNPDPTADIWARSICEHLVPNFSLSDVTCRVSSLGRNRTRARDRELCRIRNSHLECLDQRPGFPCSRHVRHDCHKILYLAATRRNLCRSCHPSVLSFGRSPSYARMFSDTL